MKQKLKNLSVITIRLNLEQNLFFTIGWNNYKVCLT